MTPEARDKRRGYSKGWRARNQERASVYQRDYNRRRTESRQIFIWEHKDKPCADCNIKYPPWVMDFDHVRGTKEYNVGHLLSQSFAKLAKEIAKCEVVCANCHRLRTHRRRYRY